MSVQNLIFEISQEIDMTSVKVICQLMLTGPANSEGVDLASICIR